MEETPETEEALALAPAPHRAFLQHALPFLRSSPLLTGVAVGGSFAERRMDAYSDLDLVLVAEPEAWPAVLDERRTLAAALGPLLASFTGEHVGEPRLLVCLYGPPLLHVDLKFVAPDALAERVEDPVVLFDRRGLLRAGLSEGEARYPAPDLQWIEDRIWVWSHYIAGKVARGEILEASDGLAYLRSRVLGPLALQRAGARPSGLRRIEALAPDAAATIAALVPRPDGLDCLRSLRGTLSLYAGLRETAAARPVRREAAERAAWTHLDGLLAELGRRPRG